MKLTVRHIGIRSTNALDSWVEEHIFALQPSLQIDEASVRLVCSHTDSPAYEVHVHLVTPGPDVLAQARDHTLQAAFLKVIGRLRASIGHRPSRRLRRFQGNRIAVSGHPRGGARVAPGRTV